MRARIPKKGKGKERQVHFEVEVESEVDIGEDDIDAEVGDDTGLELDGWDSEDSLDQHFPALR